jgi:hypothetical protein
MSSIDTTSGTRVPTSAATTAPPNTPTSAATSVVQENLEDQKGQKIQEI